MIAKQHNRNERKTTRKKIFPGGPSVSTSQYFKRRKILKAFMSVFSPQTIYGSDEGLTAFFIMLIPKLHQVFSCNIPSFSQTKMRAIFLELCGEPEEIFSYIEILVLHDCR
jgi:hypothetical protein